MPAGLRPEVRPHPEIAGIFFDLDGTLADTAPDLARALNGLRQREGLPPLPFTAIRPVVSHGTGALLELAFPSSCYTGQDYRQRLRDDLIASYRHDIAVETRLFPGMEMILDRLEAEAIPWGVVTNKPSSLTEPLMNELGLALRAACIVSGDTTPQRKPHPGPLLHACDKLGLDPARCVYVGDACRDIAAGRAAGMRTVAALFGYLAAGDDPLAWSADGTIDEASELLAWLGLAAP